MKELSIIIPTDLSSPSLTAVRYASMLADNIPVNVELIHVVKPNLQILPIGGEAIAEDVHLARELMDEYIRQIDDPVQEKLKLKTRIVEDEHIYDALKDIVNQENKDLVVMGTGGAKGLKKYIAGTHAASVIQRSPCPVITVPYNTAPATIKHIVYASDMLDTENEIRQIASFARLFDASIHILHIFSHSRDAKRFDNEQWLAEMRSKSGYNKLTFHAMAESDISTGIEKYLADKKVDLLAVFSNRKIYAERMLMDSVSLEETMEAKTPVLTLYKSM